jgi:hypothetical protein
MSVNDFKYDTGFGLTNMVIYYHGMPISFDCHCCHGVIHQNGQCYHLSTPVNPQGIKFKHVALGAKCK